ncbi:MAG: zinc-ribbon domain-containing protein [Clostridiales bacterium]|nr:zinc-ribbon domain-containing protein [Clostridiales bacterium]
MTEYNIADCIVKISTAVENERYIRLGTEKLIADTGAIFDKWYSSQFNCTAVEKNTDELLKKTIVPLISKAVKMLNDQGVYSINEKIFFDKYLCEFDVEFCKVISEMSVRIDEIDEQLAADKYSRKVRKATRNKIIGGGFGISGALKGMATAGAINAAGGMYHSIKNTAGNFGSGISAGSSKAAVYKNTKAPLRKAIINSAYNVRSGLREALEKEANIRCKYVTSTESDQATAILQNYSKKKIPESKCKEQLLQALILDPYRSETYEIIWNDFGDKTGDLRKMSAYFGCGLEEKIQSIASKYGEDVFKADCKEYLSAFDKTKAIIKTEANIKNSLVKMEQYCQKHSIEEKLIPKIAFCRDLLKTADVENRIVEGVLYSTRETAGKVKADYTKFYENIKGMDLTDNEQFKQICEQTYDSSEFNDILPSVCEKEKLLRTPEKLRDNLLNIFSEKLNDDVLKAMGLDVAERFGSFENNEATARTITGMPFDEMPLFIVERSNNGKSGVMITDKYLRIYSKGLLSSENRIYDIGKIKSVECIGNNKFVIDIGEADLVSVNLKAKKVSDVNQIIFADEFERAVQTINNLYPPHLQNLYRLVNGTATCVCGTKLLANERICPTCGKMRNQNGEFVEKEFCPSCNALLPKGRKFCSNCGFHLEISEEKYLNTKASSDGNNISSETLQDPTAENTITKCPKCGNTIKPGKKFCSRCGTKIL